MSRVPEGTVRKAFSIEIPTLQVGWDSTSLGLIKECAHKYYLAMIKNWSPKHEALPLTFGIYFHKVMEAFNHALVVSDHDTAVRAAVRRALELTWHRNWSCPICFAKTDDYAEHNCRCGADYLSSGSPWVTDDNRRSRLTLVRSVVWHCDHYRNDTLQTKVLAEGQAAVELSFRLGIGKQAPDGQEYLLSGHMDRLVDQDGIPWVTDYKTTVAAIGPKYFKQYTPDNQMSFYTFASKVVLDTPARGVIIDAIQVAVSFTRFQRGYAKRTPHQLDEFLKDTHYWIGMAESYALNNYWPRNDKSCHKYAGCQFRGVCGKDPAVRAAVLKTHFRTDEWWDPLAPR